MDKEVAKAIGQFMMRVPLKGEEVPAFNTIMQTLEEILKKPDGVVDDSAR